MAFDVFKNINRSMFGIWMKEVLERIEGYFEQVQTSIDTLDPLPTNATAGQVLKYNGSAWVADTDLTTGGTGVLISGTASPPASGTGSNGDYYLSSATGLTWGPKAAGAWPTLPFIPSNQPVPARALGILKGSPPVGAALTTAFATYRNIALEWSGTTTPEYYRAEVPIRVNSAGELQGNGAKIFANAYTGGTYDALVTWSEYVPAQTGTFGKISRLHVDGQKSTYPKMVCYWVGGYYDDGGVIQNDATNSHGTITECFATNANIGFLYSVPQYYDVSNVNVTNSNVGHYHLPNAYYGGGIDMPAMRIMAAWSCKVGHVFQVPAVFYYDSYQINGAVAKESDTGFAFFYDPLNSGNNYTKVVINCGSTEYNVCGAQGENAVNTITCLRMVDDAALAEFTIDVPKVDIWIQKYFQVVFQTYQFADDGSQIIALLDGPSAELIIDNCSIPQQSGYVVRARDALASCSFVDGIGAAGGIFENVREWPKRVEGYSLNVDANATYSPVLCGTALMERYDYLDSQLNAGITSQSPAFTGSTGSVTTGTESFGGETVSFFTFATGVTDSDFAQTLFLEGGASAATVSAQWCATQIEVYNTHASAIRVRAFLQNGGTYRGGNRPAAVLTSSGRAAAGYSQEAVTLWPSQWQRITILWCQNSDARLSFILYDPASSGGSIKVRARRLSHVRYPLAKRGEFNKVVHRGLWKNQ